MILVCSYKVSQVSTASYLSIVPVLYIGHNSSYVERTHRTYDICVSEHMRHTVHMFTSPNEFPNANPKPKPERLVDVAKPRKPIITQNTSIKLIATNSNLVSHGLSQEEGKAPAFIRLRSWRVCSANATKIPRLFQQPQNNGCTFDRRALWKGERRMHKGSADPRSRDRS